MSEDRFIAEAIALAAENVLEGKGGPFGAVVVQGGEVIARAANEVTTTSDPTAHAEMVAIRRACAVLKRFDLSDCEVYASCEPCPMCLSAIYWARIPMVYFAATKQQAAEAGFDDALIYSELSKPAEQRQVKMQRVAAVEAGQPFAEWAKSPYKVEY